MSTLISIVFLSVDAPAPTPGFGVEPHPAAYYGCYGCSCYYVMYFTPDLPIRPVVRIQRWRYAVIAALVTACIRVVVARFSSTKLLPLDWHCQFQIKMVIAYVYTNHAISSETIQIDVEGFQSQKVNRYGIAAKGIEDQQVCRIGW